MSDDLFDRAIRVVLRHEGGYSDDPHDPGGATKYGVSLRYLQSLGLHVGDVDQDGDVDKEDIRQLPLDKAIAIYKTHWWDRYGYGRLPEALAVKVFDLAVNVGPTTAHRMLQRALVACGKPVTVDGVLGPQTVRAAQEVDPEACLREIRTEAVMHYLLLVRARPQLERYLLGWLRRAVA